MLQYIGIFVLMSLYQITLFILFDATLFVSNLV